MGAVKHPSPSEKGDFMKDGFFQLRMSKTDRAALEEIARYHGISASSAVCMLIAKEFRTIEKEKRNESIESV